MVLKRSWAEIDLNQIAQNVAVYKDAMRRKKKIMAVVKANAYGHGDVEVSKKLNSIGIEDFAVSNIEEAKRLRENGIVGNILILGYTPADAINEVISYDITQAIISKEYAELIVKTGARIKCNFAIDTGMNRVGIQSYDVKKCADTIIKYKDKFDITGIFTHLCVADNPDNEDSVRFTKQQIKLYNDVLYELKDLDLRYNHCLNSAGGLFYDDNTDIVRLGITLYGLKPDYSNRLPEGIKPVLKWKSVVAMIKNVKAGDTIGYGRTYRAEKPIRMAVIPTGYADGYNRLLSNKGFIIIDGKRANIVGRVCMDQLMVDISKIEDIEIGKEVTLLGNDGKINYDADDMARDIGTIGYEVVCDIGKRVPRVFIDR